MEARFKTKFVLLSDYKCHIDSCSYLALSARKLLKHYCCHHRNYLNAQCLYVNCFHSEPFRTVAALQTHMRKYHKDFFEQIFESGEACEQICESAEACEQICESVEACVSVEEEPSTSSTGIQASSISNDVHNTVEDTIFKNSIQPSIGESAADFVLNLLADRKFNQVNLQFVMQETSALVKSVVQSTIINAGNILANQGLDREQTPVVKYFLI